MAATTLVACLMVMFAGGMPDTPVVLTDVTPQEAEQWGRWLCPLPQEIEITGRMTVPVKGLRVGISEEATPLERASVENLASFIAEKTGAEVPVVEGDPQGPERVIVGFWRSPSMPVSPVNADQAYRMGVADDFNDRGPALMCSGTEAGLDYALKTLKQLIGATVKGEGDEATFDLPQCTVRDWPDMEERGQWGGSCMEDMPVLSDLKFNLIERHATVKVSKDKSTTATVDPEWIKQANLRGVRVVPIIHHLEQLGRSGLFDAYPNLRATGVPNSICFAQPEIVDVVAEWLTQLGRTPGVSEVMIWLSEEGKGCKCEECQLDDRFVNETRVCVAAWEKAKQTCPQLGLRLLLTQASYKSNDKVLAAVPEGVKVSYYDGGRTYNTTRKPMIYPLLEDYVKQGRWMGVYPTVCASWRITAPFTNPVFTHTRMNEFVDKGLACLVAYAVPHGAYSQANVEGSLEWSWNAKGRTPREFAISYATRHGIPTPEAFADWCEAISPVNWDIYGSNFPYREVYGGTDGIVRGSIKLGTGIFSEYQSEERLDEDLAACEKALAIAEEIGDDGVIFETRILAGYAKVLKSVWELQKIVHGSTVADEDREAAQRYFDLFSEGCGAVTSLYPKWSNAVAPQLTGSEPKRFWDTVSTMDRLGGRMGKVMEDCGFEDKEKPYRLHVVGTWKSEEFLEQKGRTRRLDVTEFVIKDGLYLFEPRYRSGTLGLSMSKAVLVSHPKDDPEDTREEAVDQHQCHAGAWIKDAVYSLPLDTYDADRGYAVLATIGGGQTTAGEFWFRLKREEPQ